MPNYSVIIDTRDRLIPQLAYVVEENIELGEGRVWVSSLVYFYFKWYYLAAKLIMDNVDRLHKLYWKSTDEK